MFCSKGTNRRVGFSSGFSDFLAWSIYKSSRNFRTDAFIFKHFHQNEGMASPSPCRLVASLARVSSACLQPAQKHIHSQRRGFSSSREPCSEAVFPALPDWQRTQLFIGNRFVSSRGSSADNSQPTYNPGNGEVLAKVSHATKEDVDRYR
eukprot:g835.t1